jgi:hypothetical protein
MFCKHHPALNSIQMHLTMKQMAFPRDPHLFTIDLVLLKRKLVGSKVQNVENHISPFRFHHCTTDIIQHNKQCTYMHNMEECSCNHRCCVKAVSVRYSECAHGLHHPARKAHVPFCIVICGLSGTTIFFHIIMSQTAQVSEKKNKLLNLKFVF